MLFFDVTLPVFLVAGLGFAIGRLVRLDTSSIGRIVFYVFGPALIFRSVYTADLASRDVWRIVLFVVILHAALFASARLVARLRAWDDETVAVSSLTVTLGNYGTYALPFVAFAFGESGLPYAVLFFVCSVLCQATIGVAIASWRRGQRPWAALANVFRVPWVYAFVAAAGLRLLGCELPQVIARPIELVAAGAIPMQLLLLGLELSKLKLRTLSTRTLEISLVRMVVAPVVALAICLCLGLEGLIASVLIVQAGMPSAINSMILAVRYGRRPELAAGVVLVTTLLSLGTLTLILRWVQ